MTERGFRKMFRYSRPERSETFIQFSSRLCSYLNKWFTMAKVEKSFEAVGDFMARVQFLEVCSRELFVHLKPKVFENLDAMTKESKKISNDQELIQSDPTSCPQNQRGNN